MAPLVLLAGMNCTQDLWTNEVPGVVIQPALERGDIDEQVNALCAELPERFVLVGHSLGGIVAMALAVAAPERLVGLCVVSTNAKEPSEAQRDNWRRWIDELDSGTSARTLQSRILPSLLGARTIRERRDLVERTLLMGENTGTARLRAQLQLQLSRRDLLRSLPQVKTPTLVVAGLDDVICPPHFHTEIVQQMPRARLVTLDGGHLLPFERPKAFRKVLLSWQAQLPTSAS